MIYTSDCTQCAHEKICCLKGDYTSIKKALPDTVISLSQHVAWRIRDIPSVDFRASCTEFVSKHSVQPTPFNLPHYYTGEDPSACTDEENDTYELG